MRFCLCHAVKDNPHTNPSTGETLLLCAAHAAAHAHGIAFRVTAVYTPEPAPKEAS